MTNPLKTVGAWEYHMRVDGFRVGSFTRNYSLLQAEADMIIREYAKDSGLRSAAGVSIFCARTKHIFKTII